MKKNNLLENIAHFSAFIALFLTLGNIYLTYFRGPEISIDGFSTFDMGIMAISNQKTSVNKTFYIYNSGAKTAFISAISINDYDQAKLTGWGFPVENLTLDNSGNFILEPGSSKPINFYIPLIKEPKKIKITVIYGPGDNTIEKCVQIPMLNKTGWNTFQLIPADTENWDKCQ